MLSRFIFLFIVIWTVLLPGTALLAQDDAAGVGIVTIDGPLDRLAVEFITEEIHRAAADGTVAVIIQIDSPGALTIEVAELGKLIGNPPLPVAVWVGPAPARLYGGGLSLFDNAFLGMVAPGAKLGWSKPFVAGSTADPLPGLPEALDVDPIVITDPMPGLVDAVPPSIRQAVAELDGRVAVTSAGPIAISTVHSEQINGETVTTMIGARISEPGVLVRVARTALRPEATFFFLAAGLTLVAFEYFALGPGIAAAVGAVSLLLGGYGLVSLPLRWWGIGSILLGIGLLTVDFQRGRFRFLSALGAVLLLIGGFSFSDAGPQIVPSRWNTVAVVIGVWLFYQFAMPTVARSRFSTPTMGRGYLVGRRGIAIADFNPDGSVEVDGAQWMATAHRESGIQAGDAVEVIAVDGLFLEVTTPSEAPKN